MKLYLTLVLLILITLGAVVLRFYGLGEIPVSPDWDEVSVGYNAYSILKTGRDEYGTLLPLTIRSFDDYKPPLYTYLTIPAVAIYGLTVYAVRLPSAIFGILAVIGTFYLVSEIVRILRKNGTAFGISNRVSYLLPLISSMLLAISPWHIQFSRIAFEANLGVTLNIWAVYFFLRGKVQKWGYYISAILFAAGFYAYHTERIFVPLLIIWLLFIYRKEIILQGRQIIPALIIGFICLMPLAPSLFNPNSLMRLRGTSSFREQTVLLANTINKLEYDQKADYQLGLFFDNRRFEYIKTVIRGYLIHFSPKWLFVTGDHERHHAPGMGLLYIWELPFILVGIWSIVISRKKEGQLLLGWLLIAPIAASPTTQLPHAIRTLVFLPIWQILTAVGLLSIWNLLWRRLLVIRLIILFLITLTAGYMFSYYVFMYFSYTNKEYSRFWQYGYREVVEYAQKHQDEYDRIVVSTKLEQPYIFFLFYTRHDPIQYLESGGTVSGSFDEKFNRFGKYEFRPIDWPQEIKDGRTLFIGTPDEIVHGNKANIMYLDNTPAIRITDRE